MFCLYTQLCFPVTLRTLHGSFDMCDQDHGEAKSTGLLDGGVSSGSLGVQSTGLLHAGVSPSLGVQNSGLSDGGEEVPPAKLPQPAVPPQNGSEVPPPELPQPAVPPQNGSEVPPPELPRPFVSKGVSCFIDVSFFYCMQG